MGAKRAKSAYFVFADDQRVSTKAELQAAAGDGKVISVAEVAKSLGNKWRELGEAGQQQYKAKAAALAAEASQDVEVAGNNQVEGQEPAEQAADQEQEDAGIQGLPLTSVKRIMCLDEDVTRVSGDSVKAVAKLTELFLELFAAKAFTKAKQHKRATIKFCDTSQAVTSDKRLVEMGLKDMFAFDAAFDDARNDGKDLPNRTTTKQAQGDAPCARPITAFFKA